MMKTNTPLRLRIFTKAAILFLSMSILTACGGSKKSPDSSDGPMGEPSAATQMSDAKPDPSDAAAAESEEASNDFFSIMQKFSAGEIEAIPFDDLKTIQDQYGVVTLAEDSESGIELYGYVEPEHLYTGVYAATAAGTVNAFPDLVYTKDTLIPPAMQWNSQEKTLEISVYAKEGDEAPEIHRFSQLDNGLLVSLDEEPEEESTEAAENLPLAEVTEEEAAAGVASFMELLKAGDKKTIAEMVRFPSTVTVPSGEHEVNSAEEFLPYYDELFTEEFIKAVLDADQEVFVHDGLISFGEGQIWFFAPSADVPLQIIAVNGPDGSSLR